jgi:hypothetical protein
MVLAIIVLWMNKGLSHTEETLKAGRKAEEQLAQIGGKDAISREPAGDSAKLEVQQFGGKIDSIVVTKVTPGGAYERYFGLRPNDAIIAIVAHGNEMRVKDLNDSELAVAQVVDAYSKNGQLVVMREGEQIRLPAAPPPSAKPAAGKSGSDDPLQKQLDVIQGIPGSR